MWRSFQHTAIAYKFGRVKILLCFKVMEDDDLQQLRANRLAELKQSRGQGEDETKRQEQKQQQEDRKNSMLTQILDQPARARLNTIALTKPEKAAMVESMLIRMAQMGQIQQKLNEQQLKDLLEQVSEKTQKSTTVKFDRRRTALDSDDD